MSFCRLGHGGKVLSVLNEVPCGQAVCVPYTVYVPLYVCVDTVAFYVFSKQLLHDYYVHVWIVYNSVTSRTHNFKPWTPSMFASKPEIHVSALYPVCNNPTFVGKMKTFWVILEKRIKISIFNDNNTVLIMNYSKSNN